MLQRYYTIDKPQDKSVYDMFEWKDVTVSVMDYRTGKSIYHAEHLKFPVHYSQNACDIIAKMYFRKAGVPENISPSGAETSLQQVVHRMVQFWVDSAYNEGIITRSEKSVMYDELAYMLLNQMWAPNSPQWFNTGLYSSYNIIAPGNGMSYYDAKKHKVIECNDSYSRPQMSACFIVNVEDSLLGHQSLMENLSTASRLFKYGSGIGSNWSKIRGKDEQLSSGGVSSGLLSFQKVFDSNAGAIKSGGACLAPFQKVYTERGAITVKELADSNKEFIVLSYDPKAERFMAKKATAFKTGRKMVMEITTDKGNFYLTYDHPVMINGTREYVEVANLKPGMSIASCNIHNYNGYPMVGLQDNLNGKAMLHQLIVKDIMNQEVPKGYSIHHKDEDKTNNSPENLDIITQAEHAAMHSNERVAKHKHIFQLKKFPKIGKNNPMHKDSDFWKDEERANAYRAKQSASTYDRMHNNPYAYERAMVGLRKSNTEKIKKLAYKIINAGYDISTPEKWVDARKAFSESGRMYDTLAPVLNYFGTYSNFLNELAYENHRVKKIEPIGVMDVYDVEVQCDSVNTPTPDSGHNFVIWPNDPSNFYGHGIVVHNTRRSAVLQCVDMDHPEIEDFIEWKAHEEDKVAALGKMGYDTGIAGEAYETVSGQNVNNSVSIPDDFMKLVERIRNGESEDESWTLHGRVDHSIDRDVSVKELWDKIAQAAWRCGDPGVQFSDTINKWNTCKNSGRIRSSNPCFTGDMKILTDNGYVPIGELENKQIKIINGNGQVATSKVWCSGTKDTIILRLSNGKEIECTPDHVFMTIGDQEVRASNLQGRQLKPMVYSISLGDTYTLEEALSLMVRTENRQIIDKEEAAKVLRSIVYYTANQEYHYDDEIMMVYDEHAYNDTLNGIEFIGNEGYVKYIRKALQVVLGIDAKLEVFTDYASGAENTWYPITRYKVIIDDYYDVLNFTNMIAGVSTSVFNDLQSILMDSAPTVLGIRTGGSKKVYDFTEPSTHWGVIEGFVVHNCSEYLFLDDTACNLASINVMKFLNKNNEFDYDGFVHAVHIIQYVLEATIHWGSFPTPEIAENTYLYRTTGLGLTNMGSFLMTKGIPYDSDHGRNVLAFLCSLMTAVSYTASAEMAEKVGTFPKYKENELYMNEVIAQHYMATTTIDLHDDTDLHLYESKLNNIWDHLVKENTTGYRNAQVTVLAPTGTIAFAMDCDSTSSEPFFAHLVYKKVIDGSYIQLVNHVIADGLKSLGYKEDEIKSIEDYVMENQGMIEGAPYLKESDYPVFDTANKNGKGKRYLTPIAHVKMVAALQPHLSGGISKTVNMPEDSTAEDIEEIYYQAWKLGCKCIALYRDGSKVMQPLNTVYHEDSEVKLEDLTYDALLDAAKSMQEKLSTDKVQSPVNHIPEEMQISEHDVDRLIRERLPYEPKCIKNAVKMNGTTYHIQRSFYDDGRLGEIFVSVGKQGNTIKGLTEVLCILISKCLQYGIPANVIADILSNTEFQPNGLVSQHPNIKSAMSIPDLISKFIEISYGDYSHCQVKPKTNPFMKDYVEQVKSINTENLEKIKEIIDNGEAETVYGETCPVCGSTHIIKAGTCHYCQDCGTSSGCS